MQSVKYTDPQTRFVSDVPVLSGVRSFPQHETPNYEGDHGGPRLH